MPDLSQAWLTATVAANNVQQPPAGATFGAAWSNPPGTKVVPVEQWNPKELPQPKDVPPVPEPVGPEPEPPGRISTFAAGALSVLTLGIVTADPVTGKLSTASPVDDLARGIGETVGSAVSGLGSGIGVGKEEISKAARWLVRALIIGGVAALLVSLVFGAFRKKVLE